jgi:hypothetical protein
MMILPIVFGGITVGLLTILHLQTSVSSRLDDSADAQDVSASFERDVQGATQLTTSSTVSGQCGSGTQLLGLEWDLNAQTGTYQTVVSYDLMQRSPKLWSLVRNSCASGASSTPTSSNQVSADVPSGQLQPTVNGGPNATNASSQWVSTQGITGVTFAINEPGSNYSYSLTALPGSTSGGSLSTVSQPTTSCGFASADSGTYASTLCFVDFTPFNTQNASSPKCSTGGLKMSAGVTNTPYTMTFCLSITGSGPVAAAPIPTYFAPPTSEAFLGNNGFYTGIPGDPALYQQVEGIRNTVITITNIAVTDGNGNTATGWNLVTGDAESTDPSESLTWISSNNLTLLPDSPGGSQATSIGNACAYPSGAPSNTAYAGTWLTGLGTTTVECAASVPSDKTGTVMLESSAPGNLTIDMVGEGEEAVFVGLLLPSS